MTFKTGDIVELYPRCSIKILEFALPLHKPFGLSAVTHVTAKHFYVDGVRFHLKSGKRDMSYTPTSYYNYTVSRCYSLSAAQQKFFGGFTKDFSLCGLDIGVVKKYKGKPVPAMNTQELDTTDYNEFLNDLITPVSKPI